MNTSSHSIVKRLFPGFMLGMIVMIGLAWLGNLYEVSQSLLHFRLEYFLMALSLAILGEVIHFIKWWAYVQQIGVRGLTWTHSLRLYIASLLLALAPEKTATVLKGIWLNRLCGVPVERGIFIEIADNLSGGLTLLLIASFAAIIAPYNQWLLILLILMALSILALTQIRPAAMWLITLVERIPLMHQKAAAVRELYEGPVSLFSPFTLLWTYLLGSLSWLCKGISFYFVLIGLGFSTGLTPLAVAVLIFVISTELGQLSRLPGGFGIVEATMASLVTIALRQYPPISVSATLLLRFVTPWVGISLGLIVWTFSHDLVNMPLNREKTVEVS